MSGKLGTKQATPKQIVQVASELDAAFDTTTGRYRPGYNDTIIAQKIGVSAHAVHNVRKSLGLEIKREPPKPKPPKPASVVPDHILARLSALEEKAVNVNDRVLARLLNVEGMAHNANDTISALRRNLGILEERIDALQAKIEALPTGVDSTRRLERLEGVVANNVINNNVILARMKYILERIGNNTPGIRYGMLMLEAENKIKGAPKPNGEA